MESRPEDSLESLENSRTTAGNFGNLPSEILLNEICSRLTLPDIGNMQSTCRYYNKEISNNSFWNAKQSEELTPTPYIGDNKNQYLAELLYKKASEQIRPDKKQIAMLKLQRFLHSQRYHWKNYYKGLMFFNGFGTKVNNDIGCIKLIEALDMNDYRAAIIIERILAASKTANPTLTNQLASLLGERRLKLMYELILIAKKQQLEIDTEDHFEHEGISSRALFDIDLQLTSLNTAIENFQCLIKSLFEIANRVSAYYRDQMQLDMDEIAGDPEMVWWVLLAAQAGCTTSLNDLQSLENVKDYPFVCYALAVIYKFGILHSTEIEPNHDKAEYYFHLAQNRNLEEYVLTGQGKDFACEETIDFLRAKMNATLKK